eukprot:355803-Chlamydomonas_euryale.AAC.4
MRASRGRSGRQCTAAPARDAQSPWVPRAGLRAGLRAARSLAAERRTAGGTRVRHRARCTLWHTPRTAARPAPACPACSTAGLKRGWKRQAPMSLPQVPALAHARGLSAPRGNGSWETQRAPARRGERGRKGAAPGSGFARPALLLTLQITCGAMRDDHGYCTAAATAAAAAAAAATAAQRRLQLPVYEPAPRRAEHFRRRACRRERCSTSTNSKNACAQWRAKARRAGARRAPCPPTQELPVCESKRKAPPSVD